MKHRTVWWWWWWWHWLLGSSRAHTEKIALWELLLFCINFQMGSSGFKVKTQCLYMFLFYSVGKVGRREEVFGFLKGI